MKKRVWVVVLSACLMGSYGFAHTHKIHCPPGETLKNILLDTLTDHSYKPTAAGHFSPLVLKFNYHHYHWRLKVPFFSDAHTAQKQAVQLRQTVMGTRQTIAKKVDNYYYCHYPTLSKSISLVLYTTLVHVMGGDRGN